MRFLALLFVPGLLFGQLDSNSITVTASRTLSAPPDQVIYGVTVNGPLTATLDNAVAQVRSLGLSASDLSGASVGNSSPLTLSWTFNLAVPFAKAKATLDTLTALMSSLPQTNSAWSLSFYVSRTQASSLSQPTCPLPDLLSDAKARAQKLADTAGVGLGTVLSMSGGTPSGTTCSLTVKFALNRQG
jgi:hypothetical protein